jgi:hypothetical protein
LGAQRGVGVVLVVLVEVDQRVLWLRWNVLLWLEAKVIVVRT